MEEKNREIKERIIKFLKKEEKEKSTSAICEELTRNQYFVMKLLEELEKEGLVGRISAGNYNFWRLK